MVPPLLGPRMTVTAHGQAGEFAFMFTEHAPLSRAVETVLVPIVFVIRNTTDQLFVLLPKPTLILLELFHPPVVHTRHEDVRDQEDESRPPDRRDVCPLDAFLAKDQSENHRLYPHSS